MLKKFSKLLFSAAMVSTLFVAPVNATGETASFDELKQAVTEAQTAYDTAVKNNSTYGFYLSMASTDPKGSAFAVGLLDYAASISDTTLVTNIGEEGDATDLDNALKAVDLIAYCNTLRENDNNFTGRTDLKISLALMASAEAYANGESNYADHWVNREDSIKKLAPDSNGYNLQYRFSSCSGLQASAENAAWGYSPIADETGPYKGWYFKEKTNYEEQNGGATGHYLNIMDSEKYDFTVTGLGFCSRGSIYGGMTYTQRFATSGGNYEGTYTPSKYKELLTEYKEKAESAVSSAQEALTAAQTALQNAYDSITVDKLSLTYTGSAQELKPVVKYGNSILTEDTDYKITIPEGTDLKSVGNDRTYTVEILDGPTTVKTITAYFSIAKADISKATFSAISAQDFTGNAITPEPTVTFNGVTLTKGTDYTLAYKNNTNAGTTATLIVTGSGNFTGSKIIQFEINPKNLEYNNFVISDINDQQVTGQEVKPAITVSKGTTTLISGTDYTVAYTNNTAIGTATVTVTGKGNYTGDLTTTFKIVKRALTVENISDVAYTGKAIEPTVTVKDGEKTLVLTTDYTVSYSNNINADNKATATIKPVNTALYGTDSYTKDFIITKADLSNAEISTIANQTYTGNQQKPEITVTYKGNIVSADDYTISYGNNTTVKEGGTVTITSTGKNFTIGTKQTATFNIVEKDLSTTANIEVADAGSYDGKAKEPTVTVKDGSKELTNGTDYSVKYDNNTSAGKATVTVNFTGNYSGSKSAEFNIAQASISGYAINGVEASYKHGKRPDASKITVSKGDSTLGSGDYEIKYYVGGNEVSDATTAEIGSTVTVKAIGKGNYTGEGIASTYTVSAREFSVQLSDSSTASYTYTGNAITPAIKVIDTEDGTEVNANDYTVLYGDNTNVGTVTITVSGKDSSSYKGCVNSNTTFKITAANIANAKFEFANNIVYTGKEQKPEPVSVTFNGKPLVKGTDYTIGEYKNNINASKADSEPTVTITGIGNFADSSTTATFTINKANNIPVSFEISKESSYTYDGTAPEVKNIKVNDALVTTKDGITITWDEQTTPDNAVNVGENHKIKVQYDTENAMGSAEIEYTVTARSLNDTSAIEIATIDPQEYTGEDVKPTPVVKDKVTGQTLVPGKDFNFVYGTNNKEIGTNTATVKIEAAQNSNYTGSSEDIKFSIVAVALKIDTIANQTYTGEPITIQPIVTCKNGTVSQDDYDVTWKRKTTGTDVDDLTNVGTIVVTVTGKDGTLYKGAYATTEYDIDAKTISDAVVKVTPTYTYSGQENEPSINEVTLTTKDGTAIPLTGTDKANATVTYDEVNGTVSAGEKNIKVTVSGNYAITATGTYTVEPKDMSSVVVELVNNSFEYDGTVKTVKTKSIMDGVTVLQAGKDYDVVYTEGDNRTDAGGRTVKVSYKGNYKGVSADLAYSITQIDLTNVAVVNVSDKKADPNGNPIKLTKDDISVTYNEKVIDSSYYEITGYENNTAVGPAKVTVTFNGNYSGTATGTFNIQNLTFTIDEIGTLTYNGQSQTPVVLRDENDSTFILREGTDYTISYENNVNAGSATATITGIGAYVNQGAVIYFTINSATIDSADAITDQLYTGAEVTPTTNVYANGMKIEQELHYTYENNKLPGKAKVTIDSNGNTNYTGSKSVEFNIVDPIENYEVTSLQEEVTYTGNATEPQVSVARKEGSNTITGYTVAYDNNVNAGTATITVTGNEYYPGNGISTTFTITPKDASTATVDVISEQLHTGSPIEPTVKVTLDGVELENGKDYDVTYADNTDEGIAKANIAFKGNYKGSAVGEFVIVKPQSLKVTVDKTEYHVGDAFDTSTVSVVAVLPSGTEVPVDASLYDVTVQNLNTIHLNAVENDTFGNGTVVVTMKDGSASSYKDITVKPIAYELTEGNGTVVTLNDGKAYTFTSNAELSKLAKVKIDGKEIESSNYDKASGSTIITLHASYLNTLTDGQHTIEIVSNDGKATGRFSVKKQDAVAENGSTSSTTETVSDWKPSYQVIFRDSYGNIISKQWVAEGEAAKIPYGYTYSEESLNWVYENMDVKPVSSPKGFIIPNTGA